MEPLNVTLVFPAATRGGAELWQERLAAHTDRLDIQVSALADGATAAWWRGQHTDVTVIPSGRGPGQLVRAAYTLASQSRGDRPDVMVAHGVKAALVTGLAGLIARTRTVWVRHDDSFPGLAHVVDRLTDGQISTSDHLSQGRTPHRPLLITPVVSGPALSRSAAHAALGTDADSSADGSALRLLMATRLVPYKGVDDAVLALADERAAQWSLHVYGVSDAAYPDERNRLALLAETHQVTGRFHLHQARDDIGQLAAAFDAAAILTKALPGEHVRTESFSMIALEAMTAGVPVISVSPVSERIGIAGIPVEPSSPQQVADALARLQDCELSGDMARSGRAAAEAGTTPAAAASAFAQFLADTAHRPGAGTAGTTPISVVVTVLNDEHGVHELLPALRAQLQSTDQVIVVDGGSTDGTTDLVEAAAAADPRIMLIVRVGAGISQGRNIGIEAAAHALIACTDAGCEPHPGWLDAFRSAADARPDAGLLTGTYEVLADSPVERAVSACGYPQVSELAHPGVLSRGYGRLLGRAFDATMPTGRSMAFTKDAWRIAGGFPEHLATGEDVTFGRAIARHFPAILVRDACVTWEQRATLRATLRMYYRYGEGSGHSRDARLLGRDAARVAAYLFAAATIAGGRPLARGAALAGAAAYLSLPLQRASRMPQAARVMALVPVMAGLRDVVKAAGAVTGYLRGPQ
ncbi:MAG: glycosyltransferase [Actinomycetota bacterium]|nr:glycosyltransferase [Actinomycetota bacterium]